MFQVVKKDTYTFVTAFPTNSTPSSATTASTSIILATSNASAARFSTNVSPSSSAANTWWLPICIYNRINNSTLNNQLLCNDDSNSMNKYHNIYPFVDRI